MIVKAYLDILDYDKELASDESVLSKVMECMTYKDLIDHVLFGHIKEQMEKRNLDCRLYSAIYYLNINGGLTAADLLSDIANDPKVDKLPNSENFKEEFLQKLLQPADVEEDKMDAYVLEKIHEALKSCHAKNKIDLEFYEELNELLGVKEAK